MWRRTDSTATNQPLRIRQSLPASQGGQSLKYERLPPRGGLVEIDKYFWRRYRGIGVGVGVGVGVGPISDHNELYNIP